MHSEAEANRCTVIEDVKGVAVKAEHLGESLDDVGQMVEAVFEARSIRGVGETEAGQIRRYHVIAISKRGNELAVHMRRRRKAVQQQHARRLRVAALAIKHLQSIDRGGAISGRHGDVLSGPCLLITVYQA